MAEAQRFVIRNREVAHRVVTAMAEAYGDGDAPTEVFEVILQPHNLDRSLAQNRLAFQWYSDRSKHYGTDQEYEQSYCKLMHGAPILARDDAGYAEFYRRAISRLDYINHLNAMRFIPCTRLMTVKQMTEYLNEIEAVSRQSGVPLQHQEDVYREAMGIEQ